MKPFRLYKNHNETGIFMRENANPQNPGENLNIGIPNVRLNPPQQQLINQENVQHIRINPIRRDIIRENTENRVENLDQINNLELE